MYVYIYRLDINPPRRRYRLSPASRRARVRASGKRTHCRGEDENSNMADRVAAALGTDQKKNPIKPRGPPRHDGLAPLPRSSLFYPLYMYKKKVIRSKTDLLHIHRAYI